MKAIILARVSTEEQKEAGNSLPAQQERLISYIKRNLDLQLVKEFIFDESVYKEHRKEFSKVIEFIGKQKETIALCCDKVDRLSRDFLIGLPTLEKLRREGKITLHFPSDNLILHKDSPATDLFHFNIAVSLAQYYSNSIADNVKRAYENKIKRGEWIGKAPVGYINVGDDKERKDIIPDPARAHFIVKIFEMYATGDYSNQRIKNEVDNLGLKSNTQNPKPLSKSIIYHILKNPFYYGIMRIKGELYPHKYQPLILKTLFDKCQQVRASYHKKPFKYAGKPFIFRGMIKCADCGCTITPETARGHIYYSCTNYRRMHDKRIYVREEDLLTPIYDVLKNIQLPDKKIHKIVESLKKTHEAKNRFHEQSLLILRKEYDQIENRISRIFDLRLDDQSITKDMFNKKLREYKEKQAEIREEMARYDQADEKFYLTANILLNLAQKAYQVFEISEVSGKRQILNFLLQNLKLQGKKLQFELKTPFNGVLQANLRSTGLRG